jgi:hypothetical protein
MSKKPRTLMSHARSSLRKTTPVVSSPLVGSKVATAMEKRSAAFA